MQGAGEVAHILEMLVILGVAGMARLVVVVVQAAMAQDLVVLQDQPITDRIV
jgi:hypothetical protein